MKGITVNEALELLKSHGVILMAGGKGLTNIIESVSVFEIPESFNWLHGGELYLSTLHALTTKQQVYELINIFAEKRVAALGIHPGNHSQIPLDRTAFNLAEKVNLPILLLPRSIPYSTVFSIVLGAILNRQKIVLEQSQRINKHLTDILLSGGSFKNIAFTLHEILGKPVLIVNNSFEIMAIEGSSKLYQICEKTLADEVINAVSKFYSSNNNKDLNSNKNEIIIIPLEILNKKMTLVLREVLVDKIIYAYVMTLEVQELEDEEFTLSKIALTHASIVIALEEIKRRAIRQAEQKLEADFFDGLLNECYVNDEVIIQRAKNLGFEIKGKHVVMIVEMDQLEDFYLKHGEQGEDCYQGVKNRLNKIVEFSVMKRSKKSVIIIRSDSLIILPHVSANYKKDIERVVFQQLAEEIVSEVKRVLKNITVSIGIGGFCKKPSDLVLSYRQAQQALRLGRKLKNSGIFYFERLWIYSLLASKSEEVKEFCHSMLTDLIEYEQNNKMDLIKTMETYLDCNENVYKTAEKLFIHPNTVKYRLERIKNIFGKDPFDGENILHYHIALKAMKIL